MGKIFGTDGIRGQANTFPMTPELAMRLGKAISRVFSAKNGLRHRVVIGKDTRLSGYMLETALTSGLVSMGSDVLLVGPMPTPAVSHLTRSLNADAGIMISASHNPANDNGIKVFASNGYKLPDSVEGRIEALLNNDIDAAHVQGEAIGKAYRVDDAKGRYIEFLKGTIGNESLAGMKVVLDCANGAAYSIAPKVFSELGADVAVLNAKPDGLNINHNCGALHPELIQRETEKSKADLGIALDGDADRVAVCDERGAYVDGDYMLAVCALELKKEGKLAKNTVVATVMSNLGFEEAMKSKGIKVVRTAVGDRHVLEEMRTNRYSLGGEQSGHLIFAEHSTTGDGILAALQLMRIMKRSGKKLSELSQLMNQYPQLLLNVKVKEKKPFEKMPAVKKAIESAEEKLGKQGRVLVRYSGTENLARIMIEGRGKAEITKLANGIAAAIKNEIGA